LLAHIVERSIEPFEQRRVDRVVLAATVDGVDEANRPGNAVQGDVLRNGLTCNEQGGDCHCGSALIEAGVQRIFSDWTLRSRRRAILHDLACVGGVARPLAVPRPLDFDGVLGTMYVLEGSRLGAQVLLQAVAGSSDAAVTAATAYLRHGAGRHLWQSFLALLERHAEILRHETGAVNAARRAFDLFVDAIARTSRPSAQPGDRSARP
jgi:hypothetical protein